MIKELNRYLAGWKAYFGRLQQRDLLKRLDGYVRRRLRALRLKQWSRSRTIYRALRALGMGSKSAWSITCSPGGWWAKSLRLAGVLSLGWFDRLGLKRLAK